MLRVESSHEEGGVREWSAATVRFSGDDRENVTRLHAVRVGPPPKFEPVPDSEFQLEVDLLLALGFTGPAPNGMFDELESRWIPEDVSTDGNYMTSTPGIFAAGDMRRGQSLVVWAIAEGRQAAAPSITTSARPDKSIKYGDRLRIPNFSSVNCPAFSEVGQLRSLEAVKKSRIRPLGTCKSLKILRRIS